MIAMFDPYRRLVLYYNNPPGDPTMQEAKDYFQPLKLQIETLAAILNTADDDVVIAALTARVPQPTWFKLTQAIDDVVACAGRLF